MDLKELSSVDPATHWYYQAKLTALESALRRRHVVPRSIVDVGAGSGFFSLALASNVPKCDVVCVDPNYADSSLGAHDGARFVHEADLDVLAHADTFLFIDVLEHVEDDAALLRSYVEAARPGATFLMTVPAFMSLWSGHDEFLEHFRRYRLGELVGVAESAGLQIKHSQYLFGLPFPAVWLVRRMHRADAPQSDMRPVRPIVNAALRTACRAEHRLGWNPAAGVSAFVVGQVP